MQTQTLEKLNYIEVKEIIKSYCVSGLGKGLVDNINPSFDIKVVDNRLNETSEARNLIDNGHQLSLKGISDISHIISKLEKGMTLEIEELLSITDFLRGARIIKKFFVDKEEYASVLTSYSANITVMQDIEEQINKSIKLNDISNDASKTLQKVRRHIDICEGKIKEKLQKTISNPNNKQYLQDTTIVQRNDKYVVSVKSQYKNMIEGTTIEISGKGTTYFIEPIAVAKHSAELSVLKIEEQVEVYKILSELTEIIYQRLFDLQMNVDVIAKYDMIFAKGKYSADINGIKPTINRSGMIDIIQGVHPLIDDFEPLDFNINKGFRALLITGPNAGGKTVVLKTVGILTLMVMSGIHIKAKKGTVISTFQNIFVDIGDNQSIQNSLSTFSSHMQNLSDILANCNKHSLVLLDEIGSGTEPKEGASLGIALLEHIYKKGSIIIATTHYGEIKSFSEQHEDFENGAMEYERGTLSPLYKLIIGKTGDSNAFYIAKKMGIPNEVYEKAKYYLETKDYDTSLVSNNNVAKYIDNEQPKVDEAKQVDFSIGDKVKLNESGEIGLVYEEVDDDNEIKVMINNEIVTEYAKRVTRIAKASDLYPEGYDMNTLFVDYKTRKLDHDLKRGSKKALKKLRKNNNIISIE